MEHLASHEEDLHRVVLGKRKGNPYTISSSASSKDSQHLLFHERANARNVVCEEPLREQGESIRIRKKLFFESAVSKDTGPRVCSKKRNSGSGNKENEESNVYLARKEDQTATAQGSKNSSSRGLKPVKASQTRSVRKALNSSEQHQLLEEMEIRVKLYPEKLRNFVQFGLPKKFDQIFSELRSRKYLSKGYVDESFGSLERDIAEFIALHLPQ
jgi:hypothetical protein